MNQSNYIKINPSTVEKFKEVQGTQNYLSSSTIRFWLNDDCDGYDSHWHLDLEMIIPLVNNYVVSIGLDTFELSPGDILIIPPGESHKLISRGEGMRLIYIVELSILSKMQGYSLLSSFLAQPVIINQEKCPEIYEEEIRLIMELCQDYCMDDPLREFVLYPKLIHFFTNYASYRINQDKQPSSPFYISDKQQFQINQLNQVLRFIDTHFTEDLTLEQTAAVAGFSKYHFSRLFKQYSGQNFYEYLCFRRIKSAETLLMNPGIPITDVALRSGFSSLSTFNRTFKKIKNCTPTRYRHLYSSPLESTNIHPKRIEYTPDQTGFLEGI